MTAKKIVATIERPNSSKDVFHNFRTLSYARCKPATMRSMSFDADKRQDDAADTIHQEVAPENIRRAERTEFIPRASQRNGER